MKRPSFNEQREKIIQAYFKDEIKPFDFTFCFCGTLCSNTGDWFNRSANYKINEMHFASNGYSGVNLFEMERALLQTIHKQLDTGLEFDYTDEEVYEAGEYIDVVKLKGYEDALFSGMSAALEVLKQIHIEDGETIDESPVFKKREMVPMI